MRVFGSVRRGVGSLAAILVLVLLGSLPVQLVIEMQTLILKPIARTSLGEGWEPQNIRVLGSGMGIGVILAMRDANGQLRLARGGVFGFQEM